MADSKKEHFTLTEVAKRWGSSHSTVLTLVYQGGLRAIDISTNPKGKRRFVVPVVALEAFEAERMTDPPESLPKQKKKRVKIPKDGIVEFFN